MEADVERWTSYRVYRALVETWLLREERKLHGRIRKEELWQACRAVALELQASGNRVLELEDLRKLLARRPVAEHVRELDVGGRSLLNRTSAGSFRFAHYSIQEFLVADALVEWWTAEEEVGRLRMTDQMLGFLYAWIEEEPAARLVQVPWRRLDLGSRRVGDRGLDLRGADLAGADLRGAVLVNADLEGADLRQADLRQADLRLAKLAGANLEGVVLHTPGEAFKEPLTGTRFLWVPGGSSRMSAAEARISPFWLAETPVTRRQYAAFLDRTGHEKPRGWGERRFSQPDQPVVGVSWHDAMAYCQWLKKIMGLPVSLPTEAQWEFTARGTEGREYPWGKQAPDASRACFDQDWNKGAPAAVGSYPSGRGPFGHLDLAGNVWEWCEDEFPEAEIPEATLSFWRKRGTEGPFRVLQGGGWFNPAENLRAAERGRAPAGSRGRGRGFRLAAAPPST